MTTAFADSTGLFPRYQATYAAHRIAIFPVTITEDAKKPAVTHYAKIGLPGSAALAGKRSFASTDAFGFMAGSRSKVTVLDVDSRDEKVLTAALDRHGATPLIVRTASGKFHALYRHNGERRRIRPWRNLPFDLLGVGGFVVAPPSLSAKGQYEIIAGSLADLERLPALRNLDDLGAACPVNLNLEQTKLREGDGRNKALFRWLMMEANTMKNTNEVLERAMTLNHNFAEPLSVDELASVSASVWKITAEGRNYFGRPGIFFDASDADRMIREDPDLYVLLSLLRANNGSDATFIATNEWLARTLHWRTTRVVAARKRMLEFGYAHAVSTPRPGQATYYRWGAGQT